LSCLTIPIIEAKLDCRPPFSFYFDVVDAYWRRQQGNSAPLHRVCTLARKQGATFLSVTSAVEQPGVQEELDRLDAECGGDGAAEAILFTFFLADPPVDVETLTAEAVLGYAILVNYRKTGGATFDHSYIYQAIFKPPARYTKGVMELFPNNFIYRQAEFSLQLFGKSFQLRGVYYCQQNTLTSCCSHAALRMALTTVYATPPVSNQSINQQLGLEHPGQGLSIDQIEEIISNHKNVVSKTTDCSELPEGTYLSILGSIIESGDVALLVFTTTKSDEEHVVTVFGHTLNTDEWHPQAIKAYGGPGSAQYYTSSSWIDHFLIHDDNFGPYFTLSTRALEVDPHVKPHWIVALQGIKSNVLPAYAETLASMVLQNFLPSFAGQQGGKWLEYITRLQWTYVLRPLLVKRDAYLQHLRALKGHDGTVMKDEEFGPLQGLPDYFWLVEFSLPALFTGNRSKLGEVLVDAVTPLEKDDPTALVLGLRIPEVLLMKGADGQYHPTDSSLHSHSSIYSYSLPSHVA
jgi:hypothetical protein